MSFHNVEDAKRTITACKELITKAEEYLKNEDVTVNDIQPGQFFSSGTHGSEPFMIVQTKYTTWPKDRKYAITGLCGNYLHHFSNMQDVTAEKMVEYIKAQGSKKLNWKLVLEKGE